jgi:hypothetical protein
MALGFSAFFNELRKNTAGVVLIPLKRALLSGNLNVGHAGADLFHLDRDGFVARFARQILLLARSLGLTTGEVDAHFLEDILSSRIDL